MAKSNKYRGPSATSSELDDPCPPAWVVRIDRPMLGVMNPSREVASSVGSNSQPLLKRETLPTDRALPLPQSHVPMTESLYNPPQEVADTAPMTVGSGQRTEVPQSAKPRKKKKIGNSPPRDTAIDDFSEFD
jgi:hypothetical protein